MCVGSRECEIGHRLGRSPEVSLQAMDGLDRIERERLFHNHRFSEETREAQGKYYAAIKDGSAAFDRRSLELAGGADVLEYGCGNATRSRELASVARSVTGIDISDVAIAEAQCNASRDNLDNVRFRVANAEDMPFDDMSFDLVFGRGIVHHLDVERSMREVARVLRPGGAALFFEPLGHNPVLNAYRAGTPQARSVDEHPLVAGDFKIARRHFGDVDATFYGLTTILSVPWRDTPTGDAVLRTARIVDRALFSLPGVKWLAWHCAMELRKPLFA